jgi:putative peptidoglycan lipid II flippase
VIIVLANSRGGTGALVLYNYGWQVFLVPYAVLAVPIATSAFPLLSASAQDAGERFDAAAAASTRAVALVSWLGAALLAGGCVPAARVFVTHDPHAARELAWALAAFAPGVAGFGLAANLTRVLFACGRTRLAAAAVSGGWLLVIAVDLAAVPLVARRWVVPVLGLGNTIGLTVGGVALLAAVWSARRGALRGVSRSFAAGLAGALAGGAVGAFVSAVLPVAGLVPSAAMVVLACACTAAVFGLVVCALDGGELRSLSSRARARLAR